MEMNRIHRGETGVDLCLEGRFMRDEGGDAFPKRVDQAFERRSVWPEPVALYMFQGPKRDGVQT